MSDLDNKRDEGNSSSVDYISYLQTVAFVSLLTLGIGVLVIVLKDGVPDVRIGAAKVSLGTLFVITVLGWIASSKLDLYGPIDNFFNNLKKDRLVMLLFVLHMLSVALYIIQDGGAKESCFSSILLLDASVGSIFARKTWVKRLIIILCGILYAVTFVVCLGIMENGVVQPQFQHLSKEVWPYISTVIFVFLTNEIINARIIHEARKRNSNATISQVVSGEVSSNESH